MQLAMNCSKNGLMPSCCCLSACYCGYYITSAQDGSFKTCVLYVLKLKPQHFDLTDDLMRER